MVVCIVTDSFPPDLGGIATFYSNLSELFIQRNDRIIILRVNASASVLDEDLIINEGLLTKVFLRKTYIKKLHFYQQYFRQGGLNAPHWLAMGLAIREWLTENHRKFQIDIVDVIDTGGVGAFLVNTDLPPVIITGHGTITQYSRVNHSKHDDHFTILVELEKLSFQCADRIIAYSPLNQRELEKTFNRDIYFSDPPWVIRARNKTSNAGRPLIVSSVQKIKGAELLCNALKIVSKQIAGFECEWVGADFYTAPKATSMVSFLKKKFPLIWKNNFLWLGELDRANTIFKIANAQFVIIPSIFETFNYVSLEAATLGKPIILTETTGASYLFTHNENAWIVPPTAEKLAEAILHLSSHPELCGWLGKNAGKMIDESFNDDIIYRERVNNYEEAIKARRERGIRTAVDMEFLEKYITPSRKNYYRIKAFVKKLVKKS